MEGAGYVADTNFVLWNVEDKEGILCGQWEVGHCFGFINTYPGSPLTTLRIIVMITTMPLSSFQRLLVERYLWKIHTVSIISRMDCALVGNIGDEQFEKTINSSLIVNTLMQIISHCLIIRKHGYYLFQDKGPLPDTKLVYKTPCLWDKGPPPHTHLNAKVYRGIHTLPLSGFEPVTS
jgi:hypothetical protein